MKPPRRNIVRSNHEDPWDGFPIRPTDPRVHLSSGSIMSAHASYSINTDVQFNPLELIDIRKLHEACKEPWFNQTLCQVNDCVVRFGVVKGEFHWHKHDKEDE